MKTQYPMIPFPLIVKATDGDTEAINQILHHYRGYITKRSLRLMKDEYGNQSMVVDEVLRGRMETRLITKILSLLPEQGGLLFHQSILSFQCVLIG